MYNFYTISGGRNKAESILYKRIEGDSILDLPDEENGGNEVAPAGEERESSEEEAEGSLMSWQTQKNMKNIACWPRPACMIDQ